MFVIFKTSNKDFVLNKNNLHTFHKMFSKGHATVKMWSHIPYIWLTEIFQSDTKRCIH